MSSYIPISSQTLGAGANTVTFSSIPTTLNGKNLRDLVVFIWARSNSAVSGDIIRWRYNGDTGNNYLSVTATGAGGATRSDNYADNQLTSTRAYNQMGSNAQDYVPFVLQIFDYAQTDKFKSNLTRDGFPTTNDGHATMSAGRWSSTSAITSIEFSTFNNRGYNAGSIFSLYGIEG